MSANPAIRRVEAFERRHGHAHLVLACHCAVPLALTPDLTYRLWANFQRDVPGQPLKIPWVAVADLLLSRLCEEVGHELYEMDETIRQELFSRLESDSRFGARRIGEVAEFMLQYVSQQLHSHDLDTRDFALAQEWNALAYTRPEKAAHELALALTTADRRDTSELLRLTSIIGTLAKPLESFGSLLRYADALRDFARGDQSYLQAPGGPEDHDFSAAQPFTPTIQNVLHQRRRRSLVVQQELVAHLFAPMDGPLADQAHAEIRHLWSECRAILGMTESIPLRGLSTGLPDDFSASPDFAVIAGQQSPGAGSQAVLRRANDVLNLSVLLAGQDIRGALPPLWPKLNLLWNMAATGSTSALIGFALLYLAKTADPAGVGEALGALLPSGLAAGWRQIGLSASGRLAAWEISASDDQRAERRFVIVARPDADAEVSALTWSRGDAAMPPFASYLMHMSKIRYELRVHSGAARASALCQEADQDVAEIRDLVSDILTRDISTGTAALEDDRRTVLADRVAALRRDVVRMTELSMATATMRQTVEIAEANAVQALGGDLLASGEPDFASDDRAVAASLRQQLDDDLSYLQASIDGARQAIESADEIIEPRPAGSAKGRYGGSAVVLCALDVEFLAVRAHFTDMQVVEHRQGTRFDVGKLPGSDWQVSLATTGQGNVSAGIIADRAISLFDPDVLLSVGIAGSLEDDVKVGDIVVATRVDTYSGGMAAEDFLSRLDTWPASYRLLRLAQDLERDGGWRSLLPANPGGDQPTVHFRPIATGEVVLASRDSPLFHQLRLYHNDAAIEMEGAGIAQDAYLNELPVLVIRGISDSADGTKLKEDRQGWQGSQQRAAANAAAFAVSLLMSMPPPSRPGRS